MYTKSQVNNLGQNRKQSKTIRFLTFFNIFLYLKNPNIETIHIRGAYPINVRFVCLFVSTLNTILLTTPI